MDNTINERFARIYAALKHVIGPEVREVPISMARVGDLTFVSVDFRAALTDAELSNQVHSVIHNVASLEGHLIRWADARGLKAGTVQRAVKQSDELKIVIDLANSDKHGPSTRNAGRSGKSPRLVNLDRWMIMTTLPESGSSVGVIFGLDGPGRVIGDGSAAVMTTGTVVDGAGSPLGSLDSILDGAIRTWEAFLTKGLSGNN